MSFNENVADWIAAAFPVTGKTILEIGSDDGLRCARRLIHHGAAQVVATNLRANWTEESGADQIEVGTANTETLDADFGPMCFDGIVGNNILEHLGNLPKTFRAIYGALRPGGFCWLHGQPLWTSSRGSHVLHGAYHFQSAEPPIPLWAHLYMRRSELTDWLGNAGVSEADAAATVDWVFTSIAINRTPRMEIIQHAYNSRLSLKDIRESAIDVPDAEIMSRLKASRWWHPAERYDVNGLILSLVREG